MHNPTSRQQGIPSAHLQPVQQRQNQQAQRSFSISQQPLPDTSQAAPHSTTPASSFSQLPSHTLASQNPSIYSPSATLPAGQNSQPPAYYGAQASLYGTNNLVGNYPSAGKPNLDMATTHTMSRNHFPPMFHPPSSNPQSSVPSPQHDPHGRSLYGQQPSQPPTAVYYPYQMPQHSPYTQAGPPARQSHMTPPSIPMSNAAGQPIQHQYQPQTPQQHTPHQQPTQHQQHYQPSTAGSPRMKMTPASSQRPHSGLGSSQHTPTVTAAPMPTITPSLPPSNNNSHGSSGNNPNAAPGPIPATTPLVVKQDPNGVQWIAFEYSKDRVKLEYLIRCDVESVNVDELPQDFKTENCVYPRACCNKEQYKGNRLQYETECNTVGWALAQLNTVLRGKRGLIQRAVDSWRNSNQDPKLRSRRVRRQAKNITRKANMAMQQQQQQQQQQQGQVARPPGTSSGSVGFSPSSAGVAVLPPTRQPSLSMSNSQATHSQNDGGAPAVADANVSTDKDVGSHHHHHHQVPSARPRNSFRHPRTPQTPYSGYTDFQQLTNRSMTSANAGARPSNVSAPSANQSSSTGISREEEITRNNSLFGGLPEGKKRKFILVDDTQRNVRVRVRVTLDNVMLEEMPDSYRKSNSVYPRSFFPVHLQTPPSPASGRFFNDPEDEEEDEKKKGAFNQKSSEKGKSRKSSAGRALITMALTDGSEAKVRLPRMVKERRKKDLALNDLGYRMSWSQSRVFSGRHLFLQRSLDAYRNKTRATTLQAGQDVVAVAPHFETRVGKRKWLERKRGSSQSRSPR